MSITVNITPAKEQEILRASKWYNRQFKTQVELRKTWPTGDLTIAPEMRAPLYTNWIPKTVVQDFAYVINSAANESSALKIEHLLRTWGREGEAYQYIFDTLFCEEVFVPLATQPELENGWIKVNMDTIFSPDVEYDVTWSNDIRLKTIPYSPVRYFSRGKVVKNTRHSHPVLLKSVNNHDEKYAGESSWPPNYYRLAPVVQAIPHPDHNWVLLAEHKPYDGATCDLCYSSQEITDQEWQTAEYREWISHPGGETTANAGPGFVDEYGFPAYEEPIYRSSRGCKLYRTCCKC